MDWLYVICIRNHIRVREIENRETERDKVTSIYVHYSGRMDVSESFHMRSRKARANHAFGV